jgi:PAS domain S-box-containing protein
MQSTLLSILDAISAALLVIQEDRVLYINQMASRLLGYTSEDIAGLSWAALVVPSNGTPIRADGSRQTVVVCTHNGNRLRVEMTLAATECGGQSALIATLHEQVADQAVPPVQTVKAPDNARERYEIVQKLAPYNAFCGLLHPDGSFSREWMTQSFTEMTGFELEELGNTFSLYHPDDQALVEQHLNEVRQGKGGKYEYRIITKGGEERWVSVLRHPVWDHQAGRVTHFYGITQDITEYKLATEALRKSEERYRLISEMISDYAYSFSVQADGTLVHEWITDSFTRITGYTQQEIDRQGTFALFAPEEQLRAAAHMREVLTGKSNSYEYQIITKNGERRWVNLVRYPVWDVDEGRVVRLYGVAQDITERKRAEDALRQSEERYRIISELISDYAYCFRVKPDRTIENDWVLGSVDRITGYTQQERRAMDELALYAPENRAQAKLHLQQVIDGQAGAHEYALITKSGEKRWVHIYRQPMWSEQEQRVTHFYGVTQDITERKQAEEQLRLSEERYRIVSELISDYAYSIAVAPDGSLTAEWLTDSFRRMTGYNQPVLHGQGTYSLYAPEEQERAKQHFEAAVQGTRTDYDYQIITRSGESRWVNIVRYPVWNEQGTRVIRIYGVAQDITERKLSEQALRESEERYRIVAELISDYAFCYRVNPDRTITREWTTESFQRMTGYQPTEKDVLGQLALYAPEEQARVQQHLEEVFDGQAGGYDYQIITKAGEKRWLHVQRKPIWDEGEGRVVRFYGVAQDITERKLAEEVMRESEEKYRLMAENITDMITKHNLDGFYTYVSPSIVHLLGYQPDDLIGKQPREFIHPDDLNDASRVRPTLLGSDQTDQRITNMFRMRQKGGSYVWMESTTRTIREPQTGAPVEIIAVSRDVSERKQMEQAMVERERLETALQKERELGEMKTNLMRTLSHEFRTPLSIIQISVDILDRYFDRLEPARRDERLNIVRGQVRRLTEMLDDISFVVAGAIGHLRFQPIYTDLAQYVERILKDISTATGQKHNIAYQHSGDLSRVWIDQVLITRILNNLVSNAFKYSTASREVSVNIRAEGGFAVLEVSDHGIGIPAEDVERIFEPFYRAGNVGAIGGTGLGLNIVKECVSLHGGRITVDSRENEGTTFTVVLPISQIGS